jgi:hypothetical protein
MEDALIKFRLAIFPTDLKFLHSRQFPIHIAVSAPLILSVDSAQNLNLTRLVVRIDTGSMRSSTICRMNILADKQNISVYE